MMWQRNGKNRISSPLKLLNHITQEKKMIKVRVYSDLLLCSWCWWCTALGLLILGIFSHPALLNFEGFMVLVVCCSCSSCCSRGSLIWLCSILKGSWCWRCTARCSRGIFVSGFVQFEGRFGELLDIITVQGGISLKRCYFAGAGEGNCVTISVRFYS